MAEVMRYAEMKDSGVEWIGMMPRHWKALRGKNILTLLERPVHEDDDVVTCFRDGEVTLRKNRREEGFTNSLKEIGYQGVESGDLVVHGMDGFAGAIGISDSRGKSSPVLNVMDSTQNKQFIMYYLRALAYKDVFMGLSTGIRVRSCDLRWNKLSILPFLIPPLPEQQAIASYLDNQCSQIDDIIARAKASIEEYKAWKASVIYEAVTKGLNPHAEMKDSGVEWIGMMPRHWKALRGKNILTLLERPVHEDDDVVTCFRDGEVTLRKNRREEGFTNSLKEIGYQGVESGDLVVHGMDGFAGAIGISDSRGKSSPVLNVMDSTQNKQFIMYYLRALAYKDVFMGLSTGIRVRSCDLRWNKLSILPFLIPPLPEQQAIASYLDTQCAQIDDIIATKKALIADLESYKKSLIYEVVTGKRKVA